MESECDFKVVETFTPEKKSVVRSIKLAKMLDEADAIAATVSGTSATSSSPDKDKEKKKSTKPTPSRKRGIGFDNQLIDESGIEICNCRKSRCLKL